MRILQSDLIAAGNFAASAWSTDEAAPVVDVVPPPLVLFSPHAARARARPSARPRPSSRHLHVLPTMFPLSSRCSGHLAEVRLLHLRVLDKALGGLGQHDPSGLQDV